MGYYNSTELFLYFYYINRHNLVMIIGFDADDTLWENEANYFEAEQKTGIILKPWYTGDNIEDEIFKTEMSNLDLFGYGAKGFTLSLIETALRLSKNQITADKVEQIINLGKNLINKPVHVRNGVEDTLRNLSKKGYSLVCITKGDLLDQKRKLEKSGLGIYFPGIEVMSGKKEADYHQLFTKWSINPENFMMVGDSLKSDILPVLALGGWAVHVPGNSRWKHEMIDEEIKHERFFTCETIRDVVELVLKIEEQDMENGESVIKIYTDGGCLGNPGPGGWAFIISSGGNELKRSGGDPASTNNKMELTAVIKALERISDTGNYEDSKIEIYTDSKYVKNGITLWINNWVKNGWKTASKQPVKNKELWMRLKELSDPLTVSWRWVKGHAGDPLNEACDAMVKEEMRKNR